MFVGHYGASFAVKKAEKSLPLWLLFIAVQFVDVLWAVLVLLGLEKLRIVPGITASNPLDLYYMPYTHSLLGSFVWSGVVILGYKTLARLRSTPTAKPALLLGLAVFSHWILDLVVHRADLPLFDNVYKMGFGLWDFPVTAFLVEALLLIAGLWLYLRSTTGATVVGKYGMSIFAAGMLILQAVVLFGEPPPSPAAVALTGLFSYVVFALIAGWLEKKRN